MQLTVIALTHYLTPLRSHHTPKPPRKGRYHPPAETRQGPRRHIDAVAARRHAGMPINGKSERGRRRVRLGAAGIPLV